MSCIVTKFGGSSLANAEQFKKVKDILQKDSRRRFVVLSAPGKENPQDEKITDLLILCYELNALKQDISSSFNKISDRFIKIVKDLHLDIDILSVLDSIKQDILAGKSKMYCASRGEYINGIILAKYLGFNFFDPEHAIFFFENGLFDAERTNRILAEKLSNLDNAVIPGFYGSDGNGEIITFSRGGSDITGAVVARALSADVYENWTDVSGFLMADPSIIDSPLEIKELSYKELRELSYMGACVLHEDAIAPVFKGGISTNIRNTNFPEHPGTVIRPDFSKLISPCKRCLITGIAGKKGFSSINIEKSMVNYEVGFAMRALQALNEYSVNIHHMPGGIDNISFVVSSSSIKKYKDIILKRIKDLASPDSLSLRENLALISVVGRAMKHNINATTRLFNALSQNDIELCLISQSNSQLSTIIAVNEHDFERAMQAIYDEFVKKEQA